MGQVDTLLAALAQQSLDLVAPVGEGGGLVGRRLGGLSLCWRRIGGWAGGGITQRPAGSSQECSRILVIWVQREGILGQVAHLCPVPLRKCLFGFIE